MAKRLFVLVALLVACLSAQGQMIFSGGFSAYLGRTGLLPGGGLGMEIPWESFFSSSPDELTCFTMDLEFLAVPSDGGPTGSGFVMPLALKERFVRAHDLALSAGAGVALVMLDEYSKDSWGYWSDYTSVSPALYAEGGVQWLFKPPFLLAAMARLGLLFASGAIEPFIGCTVQLGLLTRSGR